MAPGINSSEILRCPERWFKQRENGEGAPLRVAALMAFLCYTVGRRPGSRFRKGTIGSEQSSTEWTSICPTIRLAMNAD